MATRTEFLKQLGVIVAGGCVLSMSALLESCGSTAVNYKIQDKKIMIPVAEFEARKKPLLVIREDVLPGPVLLTKDENGSYHSVLMICTHKGCELDLAGNQLLCPCHGSQFSSQGVVISPPANENLFSYPVEVSESTITISIQS